MNTVPDWIDYDPNDDVLTVNGHKIARELLETITVSPCGVFYRIVERKDGVITVAFDRSYIEAAAPDLHGAAVELDRWALVIESAVRAATGRSSRDHEAIVAALKANAAAIAKATGAVPKRDAA